MLVVLTDVVLFLLVIQANSRFNKNVAALENRGHVLPFESGAPEVHRNARTWFDDKEIYEWFAMNLHRVREPSLRHYVRAHELKATRVYWTEVLAAEVPSKRERLSDFLVRIHNHGSPQRLVGRIVSFENAEASPAEPITAV